MAAQLTNWVYNCIFTCCYPKSEEQMYQQTGLFLYRFRYVFASILTLAFLMLVSALVTAIGSGTVLDSKTHPIANSMLDVSAPDSPNAVTVGVSALANETQHVLLSTGSTLYGTCRSVTTATAA